MWIKLLMNKWVVGGLAIAGIAGAAYLYGRDAGFGSGFDKAYERYQIDMDSIYEAWEGSIDERDAEWANAISLQINELQESIERNKRDEQRQSELIKRLSVIERRFGELNNEIDESSDLGTCNLSGDFDRLLDAATAPSGASADESGPTPGDSPDSPPEAP